MKVFFDTNVYVAEAILGQAAERMVEATRQASWRIFCGAAVLDEVERVLTQKLGFSRRFALLTQNVKICFLAKSQQGPGKRLTLLF
jgi:predicted nucleic acid-binding protein